MVNILLCIKCFTPLKKMFREKQKNKNKKKNPKLKVPYNIILGPNGCPCPEAQSGICNTCSYVVVCLPVPGINTQAVASELSSTQTHKPWYDYPIVLKYWDT